MRRGLGFMVSGLTRPRRNAALTPTVLLLAPLLRVAAQSALAKAMSIALSPALCMAELGAQQGWLQQPAAANRRPLVLVLVPSRELGAQVALQLHSLVGGNVRQVVAVVPRDAASSREADRPGRW